MKGPAEFKALSHSEMSEEEKLIWPTYKDQGLDQSASIFERMNMSEMDAMFDREGDRVTVKPGLRQDITWRLGEASSPGLVQGLAASVVGT